MTIQPGIVQQKRMSKSRNRSDIRGANKTCEEMKRQTNYFVYHNTFAAPNVKVDFIGNATATPDPNSIGVWPSS